ncbi:hypothetical protein [Haloarcula marina]|nr:hypothetical protein [Halomicroarcula marina]
MSPNRRDRWPLRFETVGGEAVVSVGGVDVLARCDPSAVVAVRR